MKGFQEARGLFRIYSSIFQVLQERSGGLPHSHAAHSHTELLCSPLVRKLQGATKTGPLLHIRVSQVDE
ncbi:hypothetical protein KFK09_008309 [Dendrobium nobile]|uniref:Uncharacterized protein n=1 Tax=Dendrobium nobile TaxID=94219 RepID=A0A8T3BQJ9_DENNO|nr:hypothetical protein KFK09_008309 [Dendrobium nobile]